MSLDSKYHSLILLLFSTLYNKNEFWITTNAVIYMYVSCLLHFEPSVGGLFCTCAPLSLSLSPLCCSWHVPDCDYSLRCSSKCLQGWILFKPCIQRSSDFHYWNWISQLVYVHIHCKLVIITWRDYLAFISDIRLCISQTIQEINPVSRLTSAVVYVAVACCRGWNVCGGV